VRLSRKEVFSFSIARKLLGAFEGTPLEIDMRSTLAKIEESLEGSVSLDIEGLTENLSVVAEDHVIIDPEVWADVARFISRSEQVRMTYIVTHCPVTAACIGLIFIKRLQRGLICLAISGMLLVFTNHPHVWYDATCSIEQKEGKWRIA